MKKVINKGYTITVTSWENDADNYQTVSNTVDTLEKVILLNKVLPKLFRSVYNGGLVGNSTSHRDYNEEEVIEYIKQFPSLIPKGYSEMDVVQDLQDTYMGDPSEYFCYRVFSSMSVTYSPEDIYLEEIDLTIK